MKIIYLILVISIISKGEILFFDLNDNPKEIEAAQRAAKRRNEKLIVYPSISASDKKEIESTKEELHKARSLFFECSNKIGGSACKDLRANFDLARNKHNSTLEKNQMNPRKLNKIMEDLKDNNTKISSIVISGHDGNGFFTGTYGNLTDNDLYRAVSNNTPVADGVRSLLLWGCYSANIGSLLTHWKKALPQAELIAGFDDSAPLGNKPANWAYLEDVLVKEKNLTSIKDSKTLQRVLKQLNGATKMHSSICVRDNYADMKKSIELSQATKLCQTIQDESAAVFKCYLHAERPKCENPPENTSNNELRSLYNKLQSAKHCREIFDSQGISLPSPEEVIRLIFFKNVKINFANNAKDKIIYFNELIEKIGAPESLKWTDISKMSRADIIDKLNAINQFLTSSRNEKGPFTPEIQTLTNGYYRFQSMLANLDVDFPWVEPDLHDQSSIESSFDGFDHSTLESNRFDYESNRANEVLNQEIKRKIENTEWGKRLNKIEQDIISQNELFIRNAMSQEEFDAHRNKISELQNQRSELLKENLPKSDIPYAKIIERLKAETYPNLEGKKIFDDNLESLSKNDASTILLEYFDKKSTNRGFGFGGVYGGSRR